jgi:hypothetical protein
MKGRRIMIYFPKLFFLNTHKENFGEVDRFTPWIGRGGGGIGSHPEMLSTRAVFKSLALFE